ncbi:hypothetical protein [Actinosynnema sp. NPDC020468]|uniref:hypothetical protein n=1 Tax=Actinosynnema sp. NPDC020468 TaxID=3154488 RepID=UPI0033E70300
MPIETTVADAPGWWMPATPALFAVAVIPVVGVPPGTLAAEPVRGGRERAFDAVSAAVGGFVAVAPVAGRSGPDSSVPPAVARAIGPVDRVPDRPAARAPLPAAPRRGTPPSTPARAPRGTRP